MGVTQISQTVTPIDLQTLDADQLLLVYQAEQALYDTGAFDPAGRHMRFFPRGFTVWSGFPGAGKTTLIRQTICQLLQKGRRVFLASLEEDYRGILIRLAATAAGVQEPNKLHVESFLHCYSDQLILWPTEGLAAYRQLLGFIATIPGLHHAFIDSLMCLDVANDDFDAQRIAARAMAQVARKYACHIHLVAHPRKLVSSSQEPDLNDVAGAREIGGLADNVLFVRKLEDPKNYTPGQQQTPMGVSIRKQRHFDGGLGDVKGWFHRDQRQFHVEQFAQPTRYLPEWAFA